MTTLLAVLDFNNIWLVAGTVAVIGYFFMLTGSGKVDADVKRLALKVSELQKKIDALLKHQGIEMPPPSEFSPEVQLMAKDRQQKIGAIQLYRLEHPGVSLAEAKLRIEELIRTGQ